MPISNLIALASAMILLAAIPSPSVLLVVARAIASGFNQGLAVAIGIVCGDLLFILCALNGLAAIANASWFLGVKYGGAAYLIWLGLQLWRTKVEPATVIDQSQASWGSNLMSGFLITVSDPKAILFYLSFFPAYVNVSKLSAFQISIIVAIAILSVGGVKVIYAYGAGRARTLFSNVNARTMMNRVAGTIVIGTGVMLGVSP